MDRTSLPWNHSPLYLSIDPGTTGALALVHGSNVVVFDVPTRTEETADGKSRTRVDLPALAALVRSLACLEPVAVIEDVGGRKGDQAWTIGILMYTAGALAMACAAAGIPVRYVQPKQWKGALKLKGGKANKDAGRILAAKLFPSAARDVARVKDHNRAEAILIGHWAGLHGVR